MRSLALSKVTDSGACPPVFLSCEVSNRHDILLAFSSSADNGYSSSASESHNFTNGCVQREGGVRWVEQVEVGVGWRWRWQQRGLGRRRWLLTLARFMARPREFERRRAAAVRAFMPKKFPQE